MDITRQLISNLIDVNYEDLDSDTVDYARMRIIDTIGCLLGGIHSSGADMVLDMVRGWGGSPESTVLGLGYKLPAANVALAMGVMARSNDFEPAGGPDINGTKSPGHYSATSVPTAFVMTEKLGLSGKDLITALVLGDDLASRIGNAGAGPWDLGWDPAATCSRFAAAAIAGRLMNLNREQMTNALGIVFTQIGGTMQPVMEYTHSFKISQGLAGWNGIMSVELAKRGFTGPKDFLFGPFGYYQQYCREVREEILTAGLGEQYYADEEFKLFPCCRGNHSSIETVLKIVTQDKIDANDIDEVRIKVNSSWNGSFLIQPFQTQNSPQAAAILNLYYNVASIILRKDIKLDYYKDEAINDPEIAGLINKIKVDLTGTGKRMTSQVIIRMKDGREYAGLTELPRGDYRLTPLTREEIKNKFFTNVKYSGVITLHKADKAYELLNRLEDLDNINELVETLTS